MQAEDASRDLRKQKQDRYAEMRRRKDDEREAEELRKACYFKGKTPKIPVLLGILRILTNFQIYPNTLM